MCAGGHSLGQNTGSGFWCDPAVLLCFYLCLTHYAGQLTTQVWYRHLGTSPETWHLKRTWPRWALQVVGMHCKGKGWHLLSPPLPGGPSAGPHWTCEAHCWNCCDSVRIMWFVNTREPWCLKNTGGPGFQPEISRLGQGSTAAQTAAEPHRGGDAPERASIHWAGCSESNILAPKHWKKEEASGLGRAGGCTDILWWAWAPAAPGVVQEWQSISVPRSWRLTAWILH